MEKKYSFLALCLFICFTASCDKVEKWKGENSFHVGFSSNISTLDPAKSNDTVSGTVINQMYETLYEYNYLKRPYSLKPSLASEMPKIENNGTRYIIKIRKGVLYHDDSAFAGKPRYVKAADFITQIKRLAFKGTGSSGWWLFDSKVKGLDDFRKKAGRNFAKFESLNISGLQAPDDHTLIIDLIQPYPQLLSGLTMAYTVPLPLEVIKKYNNDLSHLEVGTGPFKLKSWKKSSVLTLDRFEGYRKLSFPKQGDRWAKDKDYLKDADKNIPFLDTIRFKIIKDERTRWLSFFSKKLDILRLPKDNYSTVIGPNGDVTKELMAQDIKLQLAPKLTFWWLAFNMKDPLIGKNRYLRLAMAHAVDVDKYIERYFIGQKANSIYSPGIPGYSPSVQLPYKYNIKLAKEYLKKAGYPDGKGLPEINFDTRGVGTANIRGAKQIKDDLALIGIKVRIIANTFNQYLKKVDDGKAQFWEGGWVMDYPDAENVLQLLYSQNFPPGPNTSMYSNPQFDNNFEQLRVMPDGPEKYALMREMENIVHNDLPWIMLHYSKTYILYHGYLKNYRHSDVIMNYMKYLRVVEGK